ncbi:hypothetical protein ACN20G_01050 [Streptomyces sp. BI20]|uniref:hypothetical protein n=1 Tax=Streptomyces sp. BI20 TaxID=3403460 RepID=UPI003C77251B
MAALARILPDRTLVFATGSSINTGTNFGDQHTSSAPAPETRAAPRQGPVSREALARLKERFVPTDAYPRTLAALDRGPVVLFGTPGSGRLTLALAALTHGHEDPVVLQVDGTVDLASWVPLHSGVHGYLIMSAPDAPPLKEWDLSRLADLMDESGARLIVLRSESTEALPPWSEDLGDRVVLHRPPSATDVFLSHLVAMIPDPFERRRRILPFLPGLLPHVLVPGLPPRQAVRVAEAVLRSDPGIGQVSRVRDELIAAWADDIAKAANERRELWGLVLSLCVHGGRGVDLVLRRANALLGLVARDSPRAAASSMTRMDLHDLLPSCGATSTVVQDTGRTAVTVDFLWASVAGAVWGIVCRDHGHLLPAIHTWLTSPDAEETELPSLARALATISRHVSGSAWPLLHHVASSGAPFSSEIAGMALRSAIARRGGDNQAMTRTLHDWSLSPDPALRRAVVHACGPTGDTEELGHAPAARLLHSALRGQPAENPRDPMVLTATEVMSRRFAGADSGTRRNLLRHTARWGREEEATGHVAAVLTVRLIRTERDWLVGEYRSGRPLTHLAVCCANALDSPVHHPSTRDALREWSRAAESDPAGRSTLTGLYRELLRLRSHGFMRLLRSFERDTEGTPGREPALEILATWRRLIHHESTERGAS